MANACITFCTAGNRSIEGASLPVPRFEDAVSELVESSSTSEASTASSPLGSKSFGFVSITAIGGDIWVTAGPSPTAIAGEDGFPVLSGQTRDFAVSPGDRVAVIDL